MVKLSCLKSITNTYIGWEEISGGLAPFWRRIMDDPDALPLEFWIF